MTTIALLPWADLPESSSTQHIIDLPTPAEAANTGAAGSDTSPLTDSLTGATDLNTSSLAGDALTGMDAQGELNSSTSAGTGPDRQLYIVFLDGEIRSDRAALASRVRNELGIDTPQDLLEHLNGFTVRLTTAQALRLQRSQGVISVEADTIVSLVQPINVSTAQTSGSVSTAGLQTPGWDISMVWGKTDYSGYNNTKKYAIVLDTGVSTQTGDLFVDTTYSRNYTSGNSSAWDDGNGHGTHVAGTIAAINDNDGIVGVAAGANIISVRVLNSNGSGMTSWIVNGINYAAGLVKTGALKDKQIPVTDIVANMSLGGGLNSTLDKAVLAAAKPDLSNGRYLSFAIAAGNSGADVDNYSPSSTGDDPNIYTVSAVNTNKVMASWSNYDKLNESIDDCDYSAPGVNIVSLGMSAGTLVTMSGTSMAAPHMAGVLLMGGSITSTSSLSYFSTPVISGASGDPLALLS